LFGVDHEERDVGAFEPAARRPEAASVGKSAAE